MFFFVLFLIGLVIPLLFIKVKSRWGSWIPSIILLLAAILIYGKAVFFPGEGMAELGERLYFMIVGMAAIGSILGSVIIRFLRNK
jgi:hypothetical protein